MSNYQHPDDINLKNLHKAMQYNQDSEPAVRVITNIEGDIVIDGEITIPAIVSVQNAQDTTLTVDGSISVDNFPPSQTIDGSVGVTYEDSANLSAFGRLRSANTRLLGEFRTHYGTLDPVEIVTKFEVGGTQTLNLSQTHALINVTSDAGSRALRQSRQYHPYIPGTTNLAFVSFTLDTAKSGLQQMVGLFDDSNGIFFRMNGTVPEMVIRKNGVDTEVVEQSNWNVDTLDGSGPSGITLDFTKSQIFVCDYQWLGVGRVRVGFNLDGRLYYTHYFSHKNAIVEPYTYQPSLPVRWEIINSTDTSGASSLMCICFGVYVEGSEVDAGFDNSASTGTTAISLGAGADTVKGLLAVRLKNSVGGIPVRAKALLKDWQVVTNLTAQYRVMILQSSADIAGTPTWTSATPTGWCEYTTNFSLAAGPVPANAVILFNGYASGGDNRGVANFVATDNRSSAIYQNYDSTDSMIIAIVAYRIPNDNAAMRASMNWVEIK